MTRRFPPTRSGDDRFDELVQDPALGALIADARAEPAETDRGPTLETALAVYRVAAAPPTVQAEPTSVDRPTRRHRVVRAVAAMTLATKVLLGVGTAAALGGIGVAVAETVQHISPSAPVTTAPVTTPPPSEAPTGSGSGTDAPPSGSSSTQASPTTSPTSTVTDTASRGASGTFSPSPTRSSGQSETSGGASPTRSPSTSVSPQAATPSVSSGDTGDR